MASFSETRGPTSRKNAVEPGLSTPDWSKSFQTFWSHSLFFALEVQPEKVNFKTFLNYKKTSCGYF